jgi:hypothetical protein
VIDLVVPAMIDHDAEIARLQALVLQKERAAEESKQRADEARAAEARARSAAAASHLRMVRLEMEAAGDGPLSDMRKIVLANLAALEASLREAPSSEREAREAIEERTKLWRQYVETARLANQVDRTEHAFDRLIRSRVPRPIVRAPRTPSRSAASPASSRSSCSSGDDSPPGPPEPPSSSLPARRPS